MTDTSKAPERIWVRVTDKTVMLDKPADADENDVRYIRADLRPVVKPLVWLDAGFHHDADLVDTTETYQIQEGAFWYAASIDGINCGTNEAAKAAAQADYERRVLAALDATPDPRIAAAEKLAEAVSSITEYPAGEHGHLPIDPHAAAVQVKIEILAALAPALAEWRKVGGEG